MTRRRIVLAGFLVGTVALALVAPLTQDRIVVGLLGAVACYVLGALVAVRLRSWFFPKRTTNEMPGPLVVAVAGAVVLAQLTPDGWWDIPLLGFVGGTLMAVAVMSPKLRESDSSA